MSQNTSKDRVQRNSALLNDEKVRQALTKAYSPYGYSFARNDLASVMGFNGERLDARTEAYFLGNGYRVFAPSLMRFNSPDNMSPFGKGGVNSYAYCLCDPVNHKDPSGHGREGLLTRSVRDYPSIINFTPGAPAARTRQRTHSMPSLISRSLDSAPPRGWELIGYHGGVAKSADSLVAGINPKFLGTYRSQRLGDGFYTAPSANVAALYAWDLGKGLHEQPQLYEVFAPSFNQLRPGRDYSLAMRGEGNYLDLMEVVIRPPAYSKIEVRIAQLRDGAVLPKAHEAPF